MNDWQKALLTWCIAAPALVATGPFGTFQAMSLQDRAIFWGAVVGFALFISTLLMLFVRPRFANRPAYQGELALAFGLTVCFTPVLHLLKQPFLRGNPSYLSFFEMALVVFVVLISIALLRAGLAPDTGAARAPEAQDSPPLLERLPESLRGKILTVSGRDHYIDIATDAGQAEVLMRFSDALREIEPVAGMQVHRSHWVADAAVTGVERVQGKVFVRLGCGRRLPVSRTYQEAALSRWSSQDRATT